jgi:hypothetical protein
MSDPFEAKIVATLTRNKRSVSDWFLVGDLVCFRDRRYGDIGELLSSDGLWYAAIRAYLRRIGAPEFDSLTEAARYSDDPSK